MFLGITLSVQEKNSKIKREIEEVESEINKHGRLSTDYFHKRKKELSSYVSVSVSFECFVYLVSLLFSNLIT